MAAGPCTTPTLLMLVGSVWLWVCGTPHTQAHVPYTWGLCPFIQRFMLMSTGTREACSKPPPLETQSGYWLTAEPAGHPRCVPRWHATGHSMCACVAADQLPHGPSAVYRLRTPVWAIQVPLHLGLPRRPLPCLNSWLSAVLGVSQGQEQQAESSRVCRGQSSGEAWLCACSVWV